MKTLLIDGNNLIHKDAVLKKQFSSDKTLAQRTLLEKLRSLPGRYKAILVVFDGYGSFNEKNVFFAEDRTADELIKTKIGNFANAKLLTVVSSDREIMNFSMKCSCDVIKSDDFFKSMNKSQSVTAGKDINENFDRDSHGEKPKRSGKKDIDYFKNLFS